MGRIDWEDGGIWRVRWTCHVSYSCQSRKDRTYSGRLWEIGDLNGAGDVGDSEYGEKADMRLRSGEGSIGDFRAIIAQNHSTRPWELFDLSSLDYLFRYF